MMTNLHQSLAIGDLSRLTIQHREAVRRPETETAAQSGLTIAAGGQTAQQPGPDH